MNINTLIWSRAILCLHNNFNLSWNPVMQVLNCVQWDTGLFFKKESLQFFEGYRRWESSHTPKCPIKFHQCIDLVIVEAMGGLRLHPGAHETSLEFVCMGELSFWNMGTSLGNSVCTIGHTWSCKMAVPL